jgi:predicted 2-oxoglutarate/Fe(II)-dependent dioxygenase YbiX
MNVSVWPENQTLAAVAGEQNIVMAHFADTADLNKEIAETILRMERNSSFMESLQHGGQGVKVHHVERWQSEAAKILDARAKEMFCRVLNVPEAHVDESWGNIYRNGDFFMPHSHIRAMASIVYMVDEGDIDSKNPLTGKLCFADPRLNYCNKHEPGRLTRVLVPEMKAGNMVMFPAATVHLVNPYFGHRTRITLSWNLNTQPIPGNPKHNFEQRGKKPS